MQRTDYYMSEDLLVDYIDESIDGSEDEVQFEKLRQELLKRCKESSIDAEVIEYIDGDTYVQIQMPNGREKRPIPFASSEQIKRALDLCIEKYVFLGDYLAIADYQEKTIEAVIRPLNGMPRSFLNRRLFGELDGDEDKKPIILKDDIGQATIEISELTEVMKLLARGSFGRNGALSVKLSGVVINQHNKSLELLRRITDSLFFQLDIQNGLTLSLVRDRRPMRRSGMRRVQSDIDLTFPRVEFDDGPISLYWYARSALGMPLLQFLAFYQVIEYYYPTYFQEDARKRIKSVLKDPAFRSDRDADIGRVLSIVSGSGRGFGDEKSQLRATLNACLDPVSLREFFEEDVERVEFFSGKQKGLTDYKIPLASKDADLRNSVTDLIYDIRCKIVHTKGESIDGEVDLLLPFSKEAELLFYDIELMQYVARQVLISASTPMSL